MFSSTSNISASTVAAIVVLLVCHVQADITYNQIETPPKWGSRKTKSSGPGISWLASLQLPVPDSAYDGNQVTLDNNDQNNLNQLLWEVEWWEYYLEGLTQAQIENVTWGYCNTNYTDNGWGCVDDAWVGIPVWVEQDLNETAQYYFGDNNVTMGKFGTYTMERANKTHSLINELTSQQQNLSSMAEKSYYRVIGDYMGVGFNVGCRNYISETLDAADAFDSAGWQAATTLMALLPALLTFGNLFVPRSSEAFGTSFLVGVMSAVFSLGLPVRSISGVRKKQVVDISSFGYLARESISIFGKAARRLASGQKRRAVHPVPLEDLQKWSVMAPRELNPQLSREQEATDCSFGSIKRQTLKWERRAHMWHISSIVVALAQVALFLLAIGPLFLGFGTPLLIFDCNNYWTSLWLIVSAAISALFRFLMWERGAHERVKLYALSETSKAKLRQFVDRTAIYHPVDLEGFMYNTTETELPPLHPPFLTTIGNSVWRFFRLGPEMYHNYKEVTQRQNSSSYLQTFKGSYQEVQRHRLSLHVGPQPITTKARLQNSLKLFWTHFLTNAKSPIQFLRAGISKKPRRTSPMRWRPLIILMHLSTGGRNPLTTLFTGLVEGAILLILTVFFGAQWGGNLLVLCYVMATLLVTITIGRALGLWYVCKSTRVFGLHVIESQSPRHINGVLRILCSMKEILVFVNGAWYFEGYRLDEREGWAEWRSEYERGDYDDDHHVARSQAGRSSVSALTSSRHGDGVGYTRYTSVLSPSPPRVSFSTARRSQSLNGDPDAHSHPAASPGSNGPHLVSPIGSLRTTTTANTNASSIISAPDATAPSRDVSRRTNRRQAYTRRATEDSTIPLVSVPLHDYNYSHSLGDSDPQNRTQPQATGSTSTTTETLSTAGPHGTSPRPMT